MEHWLMRIFGLFLILFMYPWMIWNNRKKGFWDNLHWIGFEFMWIWLIISNW